MTTAKAARARAFERRYEAELRTYRTRVRKIGAEVIAFLRKKAAEEKREVARVNAIGRDLARRLTGSDVLGDLELATSLDDLLDGVREDVPHGDIEDQQHMARELLREHEDA